MNLLENGRLALKMEVRFRLRTPLLLRSGRTGDFSDSTIERAGDDQLFVNGYVWASLLRRTLARLANGKELAGQIGKYKNKDKGGVSPLWCEQSLVKLPATDIAPGIAIDRKYGRAKGNALYSDELVPAGLPLTLQFTLFASKKDEIEAWRQALLDALKLIDDTGIENIGGGWGYGYGRLQVAGCRWALLDLSGPEGRRQLWRWEGLDWQDAPLPEAMPDTLTPVTWFEVSARVAPGQLMAVKSDLFPMEDIPHGKLPDSFVFRRSLLNDQEKIENRPVIPGKAIRQALLSAPLERRWSSRGQKICRETIQCPKEKRCFRCRWFGSTDTAGIVAVTDAFVENPSFQVVSRVQLCEHSMQNMNLFSGEYLSGGAFGFRILIDEGRAAESALLVDEIKGLLVDEIKGLLVDEIKGLLEEMKGEKAPPGWYRLGGTAACTGQVQVLDYRQTRSPRHEK